jgi:hypothetical protein
MREFSSYCVLSILTAATPALGSQSALEDGPPVQAPALSQTPDTSTPAEPATSVDANKSLQTAEQQPGASAHLGPVSDTTPQDTPRPIERGAGSVAGPRAKDEDRWHLDYYGYFRAPMRFGIAKRDGVYPGQATTTIHSPLVPDDQYLSWQHTNHARRDWAEMFFGYGNGWVKGVLALQGFNFTDGSSYLSGTQFGIGQGWLEVTPPLPWDNVRFKVKAGSFWSRYGQMGQWDAGEYDTYLFGRTHVMGETIRLEFDLPDQPLTIGLEHGFGTKRPDPQIYNAARFTLLHHAHVELRWNDSISASLHYLHNFTQEEARFTGPQPAWVYPSNYSRPYMGTAQPDGKMTILGGDARFDLPDLFGYLYLGASYISLKNATTIAPAVEVIHSFGGGEFNMGVTSNYLDSEICRWGISPSCSGGNGHVLTLAGQYVAKASDLFGETPFAQGQDLTLKLYGMWNRVGSDDPVNDKLTKWKVGTDVLFDAFPILGLGTRFDYLAPNSRIKNQNFMVLSPRIVFRSQLVTHEQISLQYSRYFYAKRECDLGTPSDIPRSDVGNPPVRDVPGLTTPWPFGTSEAERQCVQPPPSPVTPDGFGATTENQDPRLRAMPVTGAHLRPDVNVITLEATMWW